MNINNKEKMQQQLTNKWRTTESSYYDSFKSSDIIMYIEKWIKEILIDNIANNVINSSEDFKEWFNNDVDIGNNFIDYYSNNEHHLFIRDVDDIMSFVRNNLDDTVYDDDDYYTEIRENFWRQVRVVIYTIAKEIFETIS